MWRPENFCSFPRTAEDGLRVEQAFQNLSENVEAGFQPAPSSRPNLRLEAASLAPRMAAAATKEEFTDKHYAVVAPFFWRTVR